MRLITNKGAFWHYSPNNKRGEKLMCCWRRQTGTSAIPPPPTSTLRDVAIREFSLPGYGFADYLLYVDGKAAGVIVAKKEGVTLTGVETQSDKYTKAIPASLPGIRRNRCQPFMT